MITYFYLTQRGDQTDTTTPGQNGPGNNGNEGVLYISQKSRVGASP